MLVVWAVLAVDVSARLDALVALAQKKLISYSSIARMGFVTDGYLCGDARRGVGM